MSRELDYQIASLMGDRLIKRGKWKGYWKCGRGHYYSDEDGGPLHYSTDIASAWRIIDMLGIRHSPSLYQIARWYCNFLYEGERIEACATTAPHAICLAALALFGRAAGEDGVQ